MGVVYCDALHNLFNTMKKFIFALALVILAASSAFTQSFREITLISETNGSVEDTVTNTGVRIISFKDPVPQYYDGASVSVTLTKISGTGAGVVRFVASHDGINYFRINRTDSLIVSNLTAVAAGFTIAPHAYKYLGISYTGAGTMAYKMRGSAVVRRRP
jgi:hypothetical protein